MSSPLVVLPAVTVGNYLIVETKWDRFGPYRFLIDTGSSVTHVSPELAARYPARNSPPESIPQVRVKSATGETTVLPSTTLSKIDLGGARFEQVKVLIYDCAQLSAHLGIKIDGILGFPLFRETLLTLDYPQSRLILSPWNPTTLVPGTPIPFNNTHRTPLIPIRIGSQEIVALIDSGSDAGLHLNPKGLIVDFESPPRPTVLVGTLTGDHFQEVARIRESLTIGEYTLPKPMTYLTDGLSSLGGELLKHFSLTFDQERNRVTFYRELRGPLSTPAKRSTGLRFSKTPAYWRVASVVPDSPASTAGVQSGDLISRINGEPILAWDLRRFEQLVAGADKINFTFLHGTEEKPLTLPVFDLVP
ncbi:MAG: aspartyl protease family protein [Cephaloticoccus sp.]|nr:aspartyl protease family protein [Cephaloticoccus sp.]MCF7761095.1 aspartyl protease family protein [Cephaloticoccus sp.]